MIRPALFRGEVLAGAALVLVGLLALTRADRPAPPDAGARPVVLDPNVASRDALGLLPGVGPAAAERIVAGRPWRSVDDLRPVLGDALFEGVRPHLAIAPVSSR